MIIDVKGLNFTYRGGKEQVLYDLNFGIEEGEIYGFLGPSGSGKSTTQKLLIGLLKGYEGEVSLLGKDVRAWGTGLYERLGVGFELPNHFSQLTGLENLKLFASMYDKKSLEPVKALEMVGLSDAAEQHVKNYSKGMMMRLNFVRALLHDPEILFLDEPTAGLDPVNARKLKDIILELKAKGKTIFLTTHNMTDADELCDRIAFIVDGKIELVDSPRNLKLAHGQKQVLVEYKEEGTSQEASYDLEGLGQNEDFLALLKADAIETIHSQEATLEDVFIKTTGRSLR